MAIKDVYLLPRTILIDIEVMTEYVDVDVDDIMNTVKKRYKGDITFTNKDLADYIKIINEKKKSLLPLPMSASDLLAPNGQVNNLDNSPVVDYKNRASVMEYYRFKVLQRLKALESQQGIDKRTFAEGVEQLMLGYMKVGSEIIEKEEKLKLNFQESNKYQGYIKEQIDKLLIIVRGVIKSNVPEEQYIKIKEQLTKILELYKF